MSERHDETSTTGIIQNANVKFDFSQTDGR